MKETLLLLKNFIRKPRQVGAIFPSSKTLTKEILKSVDFKNCKTIVELGPGPGTFTKEILRKASNETKVICFEVNKKFCNHLKKELKNSNLVVINAGAEKIDKELKKLGIKNADYIICGLPLKNFSENKRKIILNLSYSSLKEEGKMVLFQYTNGISKMLESYFKNVRRKFVAMNVPPAFVYVCKK